MKVSIVIPCYNSGNTIHELLDSLLKQECKYSWEVIVADNGSTDNSLDVVKRHIHKFDSLKIVSASRKRGAAYARNIGVENSSGEFILFCDSDDVVGDDWLKEMTNAFVQHDFIACRWEIEKLNSASVVKTRGEGQTEGLMDFAIVKYLPHASGGTLGIKKSIHDRIGGFDESFLYLQDTDYCWRVQLNGTKLSFVAGAIMHMRYRENLWQTYLQSVHWATDDIKLYKNYLDRGMPLYPTKQSAVTFYRFMKKLPDLFLDKRRQSFIWKAGMIFGSIRGSLKYRKFLIH